MEWKDVFFDEMKQPYFKELMEKVNAMYKTETIYPPYENIYNALMLTPLENVKVVIIGQDPYQTPGFANGLAFSVNKGVMIPKSLQNMFKEMVDDLGVPYPTNGDLTPWAKRGVLLLNRILTVKKNESLSHKGIGWETFTEHVIKTVNKCNWKIVFILLGNKAKEVKQFLNNSNHLIIEAPHPSPLSAYQGFFGSKIYSKTCNFLNLSSDFWRLP